MSYITISKENYFHNLSFISKFINKNNIIAVLKDNAYGHGLDEISSLAQEWGVKKVAVKNIQEAIKVKDKFEKIIILSQNMRDDLYLYPNFVYSVNNIENLNKFNKNTKIALKIDTGMHRNGIYVNEIKLALELIKQKNLILEDVFSHFHTPNSPSFFAQKNTFLEAVDIIKSNKIKTRFHIHASGGFLRECDYFTNNDFFKNNPDFDVRIGLLQYGYAPNLKEVLNLYAQKISTRYLKKGESVGYNSRYIAKEDIKISCYDIGYGDGFFRFDAKNDLVLENGDKILGCMSMDSFSVQGDSDEICMFKNVSFLANFFNTIEYEILVKLNKDIKRYII